VNCHAPAAITTAQAASGVNLPSKGCRMPTYASALAAATTGTLAAVHTRK